MNNIFTTPVSFSEPVVVYTPHYLRNMSELVTKTERRWETTRQFHIARTPDIDEMFFFRVLANYMVWHLIKPLVHLLSRPFRQAHEAFDMVENGAQPSKPTPEECVAKSESLFGFVTGMLYIKERDGQQAKNEVG